MQLSAQDEDLLKDKVNLKIKEAKEIAQNIQSIRISEIKEKFGVYGENVRIAYVDQQTDPVSKITSSQSIHFLDNTKRIWSFQYSEFTDEEGRKFGGRYKPTTFLENEYFEYYLQQEFNFKNIKVVSENNEIKVLLGDKVLFRGESIRDIQYHDAKFESVFRYGTFWTIASTFEYRPEIFLSRRAKDYLTDKSNISKYYFEAFKALSPEAKERVKAGIVEFINDPEYGTNIIRKFLEARGFGFASIADRLSKKNLKFVVQLEGIDVTYIQRKNANYNHENTLSVIAYSRSNEFLIAYSEKTNSLRIDEPIVLRAIESCNFDNSQTLDSIKRIYKNVYHYNADIKFQIINALPNAAPAFAIDLLWHEMFFFTKEEIDRVNEIVYRKFKFKFIEINIKVFRNNQAVIKNQFAINSL